MVVKSQSVGLVLTSWRFRKTKHNACDARKGVHAM